MINIVGVSASTQHLPYHHSPEMESIDDGKSLDPGHGVPEDIVDSFEKLSCDTSSGKILNEDESTYHEPSKLKDKLHRLVNIRQENLNKKRELRRYTKMPELSETQENMDRQIIEKDINDKTISEENKVEEQIVNDPGDESEKPVLPSISDSMLQKLRLTAERNSSNMSEQFNGQELENKFTSLSLAFKTDKLTLEKRLEIQERSRDIAEQNVEKELKGLRNSLEILGHFNIDTQVRDVLTKIQNHLEILEQSTARVSSRAEVYGAVQQEKRMSKAIEIMISHVEHVKMVHERLNAELEEARKMIHDNRPFGGSGLDHIGEFSLNKRSASVCHGVSHNRVRNRRISDAAMPKVLGGAGMNHSTSMDSSLSLESKQWMRKPDSVDSEDSRTRFQQVVAATAFKNSVSNTFRHASEIKPLKKSDTSSEENPPESSSLEKANLSKQNSREEEAFQKGFQQGFKAQIGRELSSLREQQNSINTSMENLMDKYEDQEEVEEKPLWDMVIYKVYSVVPEWNKASRYFRLSVACIVLVFALFLVFGSFFR